MKDKDVRIGMKVTVQGVEDVCIVVYEKDYKTKNGNVYTLQNEKTGKKMTLNACDFEPYIDIELMEEQLRKGIDSIKETIAQTRQILIDLEEKNKVVFEMLVEKTKEEKLEKEIIKAYNISRKQPLEKQDEQLIAMFNNNKGNPAVFFRAGFLAGRESK